MDLTTGRALCGHCIYRGTWSRQYWRMHSTGVTSGREEKSDWGNSHTCVPAAPSAERR
ncbi:hypothetical protein CERSUDRAFT_80182 [Gelatoporia subvermispora B]|uniref:Uncharacterized protein n=1 Tax=Ceriporiopsis subvermispora (strain B) TaxID=914234 RepID=M2RNU7_CERS8|nr:hypothetical protein CERSUDRAFT_80182 [Gelatoporia subvermispora B]